MNAGRKRVENDKKPKLKQKERSGMLKVFQGNTVNIEENI